MQTPAEPNYQKILVATDFSPASAKAVFKAQQLAASCQAAIELIHIVELPQYPVLEDVAVSGMPGIWDEEMAQSLTNASDQKLTKIAQQYNISHYQTLSGVAKVDIVRYAKQHQFDLIIIGRHGLSMWQKIMGSTTNAVIAHAPCDVLAVNTDE